MAPKYKLTYFPVKGVGEPIRYLLSYGGIDFEDCRFEVAKWPEIKPTMPFRQVPVLEIDGKKIPQSAAICRYLAKQFKLVGSSDRDALHIDVIVDTLVDFRNTCVDYFRLANANRPEDAELTAKRKAEIMKDTVPYYFGKFEAMVGANGGYFVNGQLTWADLYFTAVSDSVSGPLGADVLNAYPNLKALQTKVMALPNIKAWIDKRPKTNY